MKATLNLWMTLAAASAICLAPNHAAATWSLIDNFDYLTLGELTDLESGWQRVSSNTSNADTRVWEVRTDPGSPSNQALYLAGEFNNTLQKVVPDGSAIEATGTTVGTYYYRFRMADFFNFSGPSIGIGITDDNSSVSASPGAPGQSGSYNQLIGASEGGSLSAGAGTNTIGAYQSGAIDVSALIEVETWYQVWQVADHSDDTYDLYIQGGAAYPTQTLLLADGTFRQQVDGDFGALEDITRAMIRPNNGNATTGDAIYFDDIFLDGDGENLTTPSAPSFLQGDFNGLGTIGLDDFQVLADNLNENLNSLAVATAHDTYAAGDFDFDTDIDLDDFFLWQAAFAAASPSAAVPTVADLFAAAGVPEPSSILLIAGLGLLNGVLRGRRN